MVLVLCLIWSICFSLTQSLALTPSEKISSLRGSEIRGGSQQWQQPEGRQQQPEERRQQPEESRQQPEGRQQQLEERRQQPEGRQHQLGGRQHQPKERRQQPEGRQQQPEGRQQQPERRRQQPEGRLQRVGGRVMLEDIRHLLSPRKLDKLSRMQEMLQRRSGLKAQSHTQLSLGKQGSNKKRLTQRLRQNPSGGQARLKPTDLQLLLSPSQQHRAREEQERLRREARLGGQKAALRFCSIRGQKVMKEQEGRCISSGAACRSKGLLYPDEACRTTPLALCFVAVEDLESLDGQCGEGRSAGVCRHFPSSGMPVIQPNHPSCEAAGPYVPSVPCPSCQSVPRPAPQASTSISL